MRRLLLLLCLLLVPAHLTLAYHFELTGTAPTVTDCGADPVVGTGTDSLSVIQVGTGTNVRSCTIVFYYPWKGFPVCVVSTDDPVTGAAVTNLTQTQFTVTFSKPYGGRSFYYHCFGKE